jgi:hypothetical protein
LNTILHANASLNRTCFPGAAERLNGVGTPAIVVSYCDTASLSDLFFVSDGRLFDLTSRGFSPAIAYSVLVPLARTMVMQLQSGKPLDLTGARAEWQDALCVDAAGQSIYWHQAVRFLRESINSGIRNSYMGAIANLTGILSVPETSATRAQMNEFSADARALNQFFGTPGLYVTSAGYSTCLK